MPPVGPRKGARLDTSHAHRGTSPRRGNGTKDNGKCREIYVRDASAIAALAKCSPKAIKARVARLAHELADGEAVTSWHHLDAVAAIAACVMGLGSNDADHDKRARREIAALGICDRELSRTTRDTPPAYVPPAPAPKLAPVVPINWGRIMRGAA